MTETIIRPVFKPEIDFAVAPDASLEKVVIIHCQMKVGGPARIWTSTYLVQEDGTRKALLQAWNISSYPDWRFLRSGSVFTLVFEGLDASCRTFDLVEDIPEPGGFEVYGISRNKEDVYRLEL